MYERQVDSGAGGTTRIVRLRPRLPMLVAAAVTAAVTAAVALLSAAGPPASATPLTTPTRTTPSPTGSASTAVPPTGVPGSSGPIVTDGSTPGPTGSSGGSWQDPGRPVFSVAFDAGRSGVVGYPRSVSVAVTSAADGQKALTVVPRRYVQGAEYTVPASMLPNGGYLVAAKVRLLHGPAQDMRIVVHGGVYEHEVVGRVTADGWTELQTGFGRRAEDPSPAVIRIEPVRVCGDAPATPAAFQVLSSTVLAFNGDSWVRRQGVPACPMTSGPSPSPTPDPFTPACTARYAVISSRPGAFRATLSLTPDAGRSVFGWNASWALPSGQVLTAVRPGSSFYTTDYGNTGTMSAYLEHPADLPDVMAGSTLTLQLAGTSAGQGTVGDVRLGDLYCTVATG